MTILKDMFEKPVGRPIEGVIKADDETSLRLELEEYVLTNEVSKQLEAVLDAYIHYEGANGVWISGFFGSGKSHLLKILALLLENRLIDGMPALDLFLHKCGNNQILRADLKRAAAIPSKSIIFNIDQKADIISKTQIDALLSVFVKVFDEMCGYYGKQGHIAQFERDLDERGQYADFKAAYREIAGKEWSFGREQALLEARNIARAYAMATDTDEADATDLLNKYRSDYKVSIEDFAEQVNAYIEKQGPDFRLNFFVDEVGQYIADNTKLMTNLQTLAESLATRCRGRAWLIVTAQEEMKRIIGEMEKEQGNDFSKIMDRFANRMKLTSADVAEVVQKRLLLKNAQGIETLGRVYEDEVNNFKTFFDFADGSQSYRNFKDRDHFIHVYPFIPYQFTLFQSAIQSLSEHDAFEGKHSSVGERSMLGVFQQVAVRIAEQGIRELATFDLMFEGIRTALKAQIQRAVLVAERNLGNDFAVRVLKALFLVKYVKNYKATVRNVSILMMDNLDRDVTAMQKQVAEALNLLEQQTYIQRTGELYEYLTDEEKDVEQEIKNTDVENADVSDELAKLIYDHTLKTRKVRFDENGQDYPFSRKLDDHLFGREYELGVHVVSPFHENAENETMLAMQSMGRDELLVIMPPDDRLVRELLLFKKADKYIRQNITLTQQDTVKRILTDKGFQNRERYKGLQELVRELLGQTKLIINLRTLEIGTSDPAARITQGFYDLLRNTYPNLNMLRGITYTEQDIPTCLEPAGATLFGDDETMLSEAEQEMFSFIQAKRRAGERTTLKRLVETFERKPYGWYLAAILCVLAKLCAREKIEVRADANILEGLTLEKALRNTQGHENVILEPQVDFTPSQVRRLKDFFEDFFDRPPAAGEAKPLAKETCSGFDERLRDMEALADRVSDYPFLTVLAAPIQEIRELTGKEYPYYLIDMFQKEDRLLDMKEDVLDPVFRFMSGPPKAIYDEARTFLQEQEANLSYAESDVPQQIRQVLKDHMCFKNNRMQQVKSWVDELRKDMTVRVEKERTQAKDSIQFLKDRMASMNEYQEISPEHQYELNLSFDALIHELGRQSLIAVIRDRLRRFEDTEYQKLLARMCEFRQIEEQAARPPGKEGQEEAKERKIDYISGKKIRVPFTKPWLADEADVDSYLAEVKKALMKEIASGKRIQI
jgi:hypothetical protein